MCSGQVWVHRHKVVECARGAQYREKICSCEQFLVRDLDVSAQQGFDAKTLNRPGLERASTRSIVASRKLIRSL